MLDIFHCHLVSLGFEMCWRCASHTHTHTLLGCPPILKHKADDALGLHACHTVTAEQRRAEQRREGGGRGGGANFGCMACGVTITIFSAALLHHTVSSITIYCRETERHRERERTEEEKSKGDGGGGGGGGGKVLSDAGDEEVDVNRVGDNRVSRKTEDGKSKKNILYTEAVSTEDMG